MKGAFYIFIATLVLFGCALPEPAYYVDREMGVATKDAFDQQIVYKDYPYSDKPVEGMSGLHAEPAMEAYHETFSDSFSKEEIDITTTGGE